MNEQFDLWMYERGYLIVLTDTLVEKIIAQEGGSHSDGSNHEYEPAMACSGIVEKCTLCGKMKEEVNGADYLV